MAYIVLAYIVVACKVMAYHAVERGARLQLAQVCACLAVYLSLHDYMGHTCVRCGYLGHSCQGHSGVPNTYTGHRNLGYVSHNHIGHHETGHAPGHRSASARLSICRFVRPTACSDGALARRAAAGAAREVRVRIKTVLALPCAW